jgi:hypothetical protein
MLPSIELITLVRELFRCSVSLLNLIWSSLFRQRSVRCRRAQPRVATDAFLGESASKEPFGYRSVVSVATASSLQYHERLLFPLHTFCDEPSQRS